MKTLELNGREILAVEVPEGSYLPDIYEDKGKNYIDYWHNVHEYSQIELPSGNWQILGRPSEITEDVARGLVSWFELEGQLGYRDYSHDDPRFPFRTATESLLSWCKANGITEKHILLIKNK